MTITSFVRWLTVVGLVIVVCFVAGILGMRHSTRLTHDVRVNEIECLALSRETSDNSFGLTANVRSYIASGEQAFKDAYFRILDVQGGAAPRPSTAAVAPGRQVAIETLYDEAGFTDREKQLLAQANTLSIKLADMETKAMEDVEGASPENRTAAVMEASRLLHTKEYEDAAAAIQVPVLEFERTLAERLSGANAEAEKLAFWMQTMLYVLIAVTTVLVVAAILWLRRKVVRGLGDLSARLDESSSRVSGTARSISEASQQLADGATSQAASLEETSSALEEMASMTRQNADNTARTNETTAHTVELIGAGAQSVANMSQAMGEINESAEKISLIIKTIEEIAFQTNLLALNAAVEAARAGEAGKGFAVVADEVRNLAGRSAQAARDTAELIQGTVERVRNGWDIATQLDASFREIDEGAKGVGKLVDEISSATNEQAQGVDMVNTSVAQMDKATQSNAASAEECASASEQLTNEAESLNGMVNELVGLVLGGRAAALPAPGAGRKPGGGNGRKALPSRMPSPAARPSRPKPRLLAAPEEEAAPEGRAVAPSDVIPLDGDDGF